MLPIDVLRWADAFACYPSLQNTDPQTYWIMWVAAGVFAAVSVAFVGYAEHRASQLARLQVLADLQEAINDKAVLLLDPEAHTRSLTELVQAAYQAGMINASDQLEYLEWVDSAYAWAIQELNQ